MKNDSENLPTELHAFVLRHLHSVEQVEILLLLFHNSEQFWTLSQLDNHIRTNPISIQRRLKDLDWRGLVESKNEGDADLFRFRDTEENSRICSIFARYYQSHQTRIIELIYSRPPEAIGYFANAFLIR